MIVFLIGFMCAGKTTGGRLAATRLGIPFLDLDEELERRSKKSVADFIEQEGIIAFRQLETDILFDIPALIKKKVILSEADTTKPEIIIATGGGSVLSPENRGFIMSCQGEVIWLNPAWEVLKERISATSRPLLKGLTELEIYQVFLTRLPYYQSCATHIITKPAVADEIVLKAAKSIL